MVNIRQYTLDGRRYTSRGYDMSANPVNQHRDDQDGNNAILPYDIVHHDLVST